MSMQQIAAFLEQHKQFSEASLNKLREFLSDSRISGIAQEREEAVEHTFSPGFNVFRLSSDLYYRENFHSDIIAHFLMPDGNHRCGDVFLQSFIAMLNSYFPSKVNIAPKHYKNAEVTREYGHIDILIADHSSRHCIIIENKINDAADTPRQLPKYFDFMVARGFSVDAIVYIPLSIYKRPFTLDWTEADREHVLRRLCILPAFAQPSTPNLVDCWVAPCSALPDNIDCISTLRQYAALIKSLNVNAMDKVFTSKFYDILLENDNIESALSIKSLLDDVPVIMAERVCKALQPLEPFCNVWMGYKPNFCGLIFNVKGRPYKIDTYSSTEGYSLYLFPDEVDRSADIPWADSIDEVKNGTRQAGGEYLFTFPFKHQDSLVNFIFRLIDAAKAFDAA
ncbi:MAG: PD-(D/E)XK nuclease family protein [Muribaculaceae bacterium]|nr:PD-(D/E)XK nuclease family protein [Muribaculaceae bacterium]